MSFYPAAPELFPYSQINTTAESILIIDDKPLYIGIVSAYLEEEGYHILEASDTGEALAILEKHPDIAVVIIDQQMQALPFTRQLKMRRRFQHVPVILQAGKDRNKSVTEALAAGAFYGVLNPFKKETLTTIVQSAVYEARMYNKLVESIQEYSESLSLMDSAKFRFQTLEQAQHLSVALARCFPHPERVVLGIRELAANAVEHGNLGITFEEKTRLIQENRWYDIILQRLKMPEYKYRFATATLSRSTDRISLIFEDQGQGFDYRQYEVMKPEWATLPNGRGIHTCRETCFDALTYFDPGNMVEASVYLKK
jgi:CheY-like chemotaxis protein